jgi:hypothetical protein
MVGGSASCAPAAGYTARPALACIIGAWRAWTIEMISSEETPRVAARRPLGWFAQLGELLMQLPTTPVPFRSET